MKTYYGLRDYGTARWDGGSPECDHKVRRDPHIESSTLGGGKSTTGHQQEGFGRVCGRCGAVRVDRQIGLEPTLAEYIAGMVDVFREVRRVLRDDGTVWLNIGDSYARDPGKGTSGTYNGRNGKNDEYAGGAWRPGSGRADGVVDMRSQRNRNGTMAGSFGLKEKDLMMVPARLAIALVDDDWYLRSDVIWHKKAPMPESVTDRPTSAHEHIFLLAKRSRYYYDAAAVAEPAERGNAGSTFTEGKTGVNGLGRVSQLDRVESGTRNLRNVWTLGPEPFPGSHFATFPTEIPRRAIKAGTSEKGVCAACGAPWVRQVERSVQFGSGSGKSGNQPNGKHQGAAQSESGTYDIRMGPQVQSVTTGWAPSCACDADVIPATCLDPFSGSGTTMLVADQLGRTCVGIELNPQYAELSARRVTADAPLFVVVAPVHLQERPGAQGSPQIQLWSDNSDTASSGSSARDYASSGRE